MSGYYNYHDWTHRPSTSYSHCRQQPLTPPHTAPFASAHRHPFQPYPTVHPPPDDRYAYLPSPLPFASLTSGEAAGPYGAAPDDDMNLGGINFQELGRRYRITPIQSPTHGASFEGAYLSRLPLAPPLILQLDCWDADGELTIPCVRVAKVADGRYHELPFLVCHLSLQRTDGEDASMVVGPDGGALAMLYGTLVAAPSEMNDREGAQGIYFAFPDVSVRHVGSFRLRARLHRITGGPPLDVATTPNFDVVKEGEYMAPHLTRHFDAQGVVRFGLPRSEW